jgi:hypothetical protein
MLAFTVPVPVNFVGGGPHDAFPSTFALTRSWTAQGVFDNVLATGSFVSF